MILYHGSTVVVDHPKIIKSEVGRDFGFAFYTARSLNYLTFDSYFECR
ncbi:MAG: DUF3990 domain-containing protein [Eubacterium sp.]|nr:DUF3990 domain-containing protein [Eubacterium sp.]